MIDIESQVFSRVAAVFRAAYPNGSITPEYVARPARFPHVSVVEMDNSVYQRGIDSGAIENFSNVMYQVDIYSNTTQSKKVECKAIAALVDAELAAMGFTRTFLNPVQNINDASIYRMTGRYQGIVSCDHVVYGR